MLVLLGKRIKKRKGYIIFSSAMKYYSDTEMLWKTDHGSYNQYREQNE